MLLGIACFLLIAGLVLAIVLACPLCVVVLLTAYCLLLLPLASLQHKREVFPFILPNPFQKKRHGILLLPPEFSWPLCCVQPNSPIIVEVI